MTVSTNYKKELYSLPIEVVNDLIVYAKDTNQKKSHIVAEAISEYMQKREDKKLIKDALGLIGIIHENSPDIQEIKATRYDI